MATVDGACEQRFTPVKDALAGLIDDGSDIGASVSVVIEGKPVVDLWSGWVDETQIRPWSRDTITNVWSTTKTMTALMLIDRGLIHEDDPVAKHWPEFAAGGKGAVTIGHLMSHTSGVSGWEQPVQIEDIYDWEASTSRLAAQTPWWEPGAASGYHAINYGHLIGEVLRRVTGKKLGEFLAEDVASPLGADFQIGAPEADWDRIADVTAPPALPVPEGLDMNSPMMKTLGGPPVDALYANTPAWRGADIGAANGHGNARSVARIQSVISNGGEVDGVRLLSEGTIDRIFREYSNGTDLVIGTPVRFGLGYALECGETPYLPSEGVCFWGGWGGSLIVNDLPRKATISFMMNKMAPGIIGSASSKTILESVYRVLG